MKTVFPLIFALLGAITLNCTRVDPGKQDLESILNADKNIDTLLLELQKAELANRSVRFKAIFQKIVDTMEAMRKRQLEPDEAILTTCNLYVEMANTGETSLSETKAIVSSLFATRHGLAPDDSKQIQKSATNILEQLKTRHPKDAELYLISFYEMDLATANDTLNAKRTLNLCLQLDPKQTRCRELLEKL
ncbi:MAG: hypothetical protein R3B54_02860 [Bdellovibrionota bacterium]